MAVTSLFFWERTKKSSQLYTLFSSVLKGDVTALHYCENECQAREGYLVHITHCMLTERQKAGSWSGSTQTSNQKKYPSSEKSKVLKEIHAGMPEWGGVIDLMSFKVWLDLLMTVIVLCDCLWWLRSRPWLDYSSCAVTQRLHWKGWNLQKCMKQEQCNGVMCPVYFMSYSSNNPFMWLWGWSFLFFFFLRKGKERFVQLLFEATKCQFLQPLFSDFFSCMLPWVDVVVTWVERDKYLLPMWCQLWTFGVWSYP